MEFELDEAALQRAIQPQLDLLEADLNQALQDTIREVKAEHDGQSVDEVYHVLVTRLMAVIIGFNPDEPQLRKLAQDIVDGNLED